MLDTTAVVITVPGQETVHIGPFIAPTNATRYAQRLRDTAAKRLLPATITTERADPATPHLNPRVPTDPWSLAQEIADEEDEFDGRPPFPDLYTRLAAQTGNVRADDLWEKATGWADTPGDTARLDQLAEAAETWRHNRDQATDALRGIAVALWRAGMRNKNDLQALTSLSRRTIYEALRNAGIEPSGLHAATGAARTLRQSANRADQATRTLADTFRAAGITTDEKPGSD